MGFVVTGSRPIGAALAVLIATGALAAGCGGGDSTSSTAGGATTSAEDHKGGEASIEEFGSEAGGSEREQVLAVFRGYMGAVAARDYPTACSHLSASVQGSLEQLVTKAQRSKGCAEILPKLLAPTAAAIAREQANGRVTKVRVEGDHGFVVFHAPGAKLYQQTMVREGGEWKVATVAAAVLVPEL
jgi:hypothetical protein